MMLGISALLAFDPGRFQSPEPLKDQPKKVCPPEGGPKKGKPQLSDDYKEFNRKKNRSAAVPGNSPEVVRLEDILQGKQPVDDKDDFNEGVYIEINDAYLIDYKQQKGESCNCYYANSDKSKGDIHINIGRKESLTKKDNAEYMVVEITPSYKLLHPNHLSDLRSIKGKKVTIRGYLFYDKEHKGNSVNYCQACTKRGVWRKTCWEIHPVTFIGATE